MLGRSGESAFGPDAFTHLWRWVKHGPAAPLAGRRPAPVRQRRYTNQQLTSAEVVAELIELAKDVVAEHGRGALFTPPLDQDELAYYDAVSTNDSAVDVMGEGVLADIARELVAIMRRDIRTDWTVREDVRAKLRTSIKRLLIRHGYPPDQQPGAIKLVMDQMEAMAPRYAQRTPSAAARKTGG